MLFQDAGFFISFSLAFFLVARDSFLFFIDKKYHKYEMNPHEKKRKEILHFSTNSDKR